MSVLKGAHAPTIHGGNFIGTQNHYHPPAPHSEEDKLSILLDELTKNNSRGVHSDNLAKRAEGTGIWFVDTVLEPWFRGTEEKLCIKGGPGTGKTTLLAIAVDHLETRADETEGMLVGYFLCEHGNKTVTIADVLLVFLRQHLERDPDPSFVALVEKAWKRHKRENTKFRQPELERLLRAIVQRRPNTVYLLDALDEFPEDLQTDLVKSLSSLGARLIITSRLSDQLEKQFREKTTFFEARARDADLDGLLHDRINRSRKLAAVIGQSDLRMEVAQTIRANCNGMFLHAALQIEALRGCKTIHEVHKALADFPRELNTFYLDTVKRIMATLNPAEIELVIMGFVWLLTSLGPLTIRELQYALAFDANDSSPFDERRILPVETLVAMFFGLVAVDPVTQYVGLIHATASEFLADHLESHPLFICRHDNLALACIARLESQNFHRSNIQSVDEFNRAMSDHPLLAYAYYSWPRHTHTSSQATTREHAVRFLTQCKTYPIRWSGTIDHFTGIHVAAWFGFSEPIRDANRHTLTTQTPFRQFTPLMLASYGGHHQVVAAILQSSGNSNQQDCIGWTALMHASQNGHADVVRLLLDAPGLLVNHAAEDGWTALAVASQNGHTDVVRLLLDAPGILVNHAAEDGWTALMIAWQNGHADVVRLLLDAPGIIIDHLSNFRMCALAAAAYNGHASIVDVLLSRPEINVHLADNDGDTPLACALLKNHREIAQVLQEFIGRHPLRLEPGTPRTPSISPNHSSETEPNPAAGPSVRALDSDRHLEHSSSSHPRHHRRRETTTPLNPSPMGTHPGTPNSRRGIPTAIGANRDLPPFVAGSTSDVGEPRTRSRLRDRFKNLFQPSHKKT